MTVAEAYVIVPPISVLTCPHCGYSKRDWVASQ